MPEKISKGKYLWGTAAALFLAACGIKWYYLAKLHYYIFLSDELFGPCSRAETIRLKEYLGSFFLYGDYSLGSCRPFFTSLLYILTFKGFGCQPQTAWILGIFVGSLLVPLYFLAVSALTSAEVALAASVILMWMTNYVCQSIALTTILPGILFIVGALLAAVRYHRGGGVGYLYLSGGLISMSVFCRYENVFLLPVFVGYEFLFDNEGKLFPKLVYGLLCASSCLYILYCNYHHTGDPFSVVRTQTAAALLGRNALPISLARAFVNVWELLLKLMGLGPLPWAAAVAGMILMIKRHKFKAMWMFLGVLLLPLFLTNEVKKDTFGLDENHFFLLALVALPMGGECIRTVFAGLGRRRIYGVLALGVVTVFSIVSFYRTYGALSPSDTDLYYSPKLMRLTEALKGISASKVLYIDSAVNGPGFFIQEVLVYLKRNPGRYVREPGGTEPREKEYYLLAKEGSLGMGPKEKVVKVRDYRDYGYDGLALYRVTKPRDK